MQRSARTLGCCQCSYPARSTLSTQYHVGQHGEAIPFPRGSSGKHIMPSACVAGYRGIQPGARYARPSAQPKRASGPHVARTCGALRHDPRPPAAHVRVRQGSPRVRAAVCCRGMGRCLRGHAAACVAAPAQRAPPPAPALRAAACQAGSGVVSVPAARRAISRCCSQM